MNALLSKVSKIESVSQNKTLAEGKGLHLTSVALEDAARAKKILGLNPLDITLVVNATRLPMIRLPNFADILGIVMLDDIEVTLGNTDELGLRSAPFRTFVESLQTDSGDRLYLLRQRDSVLRTTSQACVLPLITGSEVTFVPQVTIFGNPNLAIVSHPKGTSVHVVNEADQQLPFDNQGSPIAYSTKGQATDQGILVIYQIPLIPDNRIQATNGVGSVVLQRDDRYPIRVTYQYYHTTGSDRLTDDLMTNVASKVKGVYGRDST